MIISNFEAGHTWMKIVQLKALLFLVFLRFGGANGICFGKFVWLRKVSIDRDLGWNKLSL